LNWSAIRNLGAAQVSAWLALLIVLCSPNYGIEKYGPSAAVPAFLLAFVGIWLVWRDKRAIFAARAQRRWIIVFALLYVPVLVSVPGSYNLPTSAGTAGVLLLYGFAGVALIHALHERQHRDWLIKWTTIAVLLWLADAYIQLIFGRDLFGVEINYADYRVLGPFAGNLHLSLLVVFLLPMVMTSLLPRGWTVTLVTFALAGVIAMLGGSRAALFFLVVVAAGLFTRLPGGRRKWLLAAVVLVAGGVAIALSPVLEQRFSLLGELRHPTFASMNHLLSYRLWIWDTALNMIADRPFRGVGAGAFQAAYEHYSTYPGDIFHGGGAIRAFHAHQLYIGLAAETGLFGLLAFIAILILALRWHRQATPGQRFAAWPFGLGLLVYAFPINSQPVLYTQWLFPVLLLLLGGMLAALDEALDSAASYADREIGRASCRERVS
jgi:O-antigen ligase